MEDMFRDAESSEKVMKYLSTAAKRKSKRLGRQASQDIEEEHPTISISKQEINTEDTSIISEGEMKKRAIAWGKANNQNVRVYPHFSMFTKCQV